RRSPIARGCSPKISTARTRGNSKTFACSDEHNYSARGPDRPLSLWADRQYRFRLPPDLGGTPGGDLVFQFARCFLDGGVLACRLDRDGGAGAAVRSGGGLTLGDPLALTSRGTQLGGGRPRLGGRMAEQFRAIFEMHRIVMRPFAAPNKAVPLEDFDDPARDS